MSNPVDRRSGGARGVQRPETVSASVTLDGVTHAFGSRSVFADVSVRVSQNEVLVVSGSNGSGKSTLLRIITGLLQPTRGAVTTVLNDVVLDEGGRRRCTGYVAPDLVLYRELTGAENLIFFAQLRGIRLEKADLLELLSRVGLRGRGRDLVGAYSSGMRQRLKYAFALAHRPALLLLDEPTANLDVDGISIVESIVAEHRRQSGGVTIIATNEPRELEWGTLHVDLEAPR